MIIQHNFDETAREDITQHIIELRDWEKGFWEEGANYDAFSSKAEAIQEFIALLDRGAMISHHGLEMMFDALGIDSFHAWRDEHVLETVVRHFEDFICSPAYDGSIRIRGTFAFTDVKRAEVIYRVAPGRKPRHYLDNPRPPRHHSLSQDSK